jgi:hypothetical protein
MEAGVGGGEGVEEEGVGGNGGDGGECGDERDEEAALARRGLGALKTISSPRLPSRLLMSI